MAEKGHEKWQRYYDEEHAKNPHGALERTHGRASLDIIDRYKSKSSKSEALKKKMAKKMERKKA